MKSKEKTRFIIKILVTRKMQLMIAMLMHTAPAHVGHRVRCSCGQPGRNTRDDSEALDVFFFRGIAQQLHAEADSQDRLFQTPNDFDEALVLESNHRIAGGTDTRQDDACGALDDCRIGGQQRFGL